MKALKTWMSSLWMVSKFVVEGDVEGVEDWAEEEFEVEAGKDGNG